MIKDMDEDLAKRLDAMKEELSALEDSTDVETKYPDLYERMQKLWKDMGGKEIPSNGV